MRNSVRLVSAVLVGLCMTLGASSRVEAGTTGALSGKVTSESGTPIAGAHVSATSPSANESTNTDAQGAFAIISLPPDTYSVTVTKDGFESATQAGITVIADNTQTLNISLRPAVRVLGKITVRSASELVKPGTSADVYSVNATTQAKVATLGGGGGLDTAYSAIAAVPGAVVPPGQSGWFQSVHIRGGDVDQVGYEFDGVPVLRSYDNYPTTNAATLGQQELQVYTGATPANSESQGLSGFINQVIKSGTYPGFSNLELGIGWPAFYNKGSIEVGGATPDRNFSYFAGLGLFYADQRVVDNSNGAALSTLWGAPYGTIPCPDTPPNPSNPADKNFTNCYASGVGPGGYYLGPFDVALQNNLGASRIADHENLFNFHIGIPHRRDSGKDDIQVLFDESELYTTYYGSAFDWGIPFVQLVNGTNGWPLVTGLVYTGAIDAPLAANYQPLTITYNFPGQPVTPFVDPGHRDGASNGQAIYKLQYQRNFSSSAYLRVYAYTYYSDWYNNGPNGAWQTYIAPASADYELSNHTHGISATYANQLTPQHLLTLQAAVIGATNYRMNNFTMFNNFGTFPFAYIVDSTHPKNGICYDISTSPATPISCYNAKNDALGSPTPTSTCVPPPFATNCDLIEWASLADAQSGSIPVLADTCGSGPCEWFVAENGFTGGANNNKPLFTSASITDQWKPSDRLTFNLGLRYDRYAFKGSDTSGGARDFWFTAWNTEACAPPTPGVSPGFKADPTMPCPAGQIPATLTNQPNATIADAVWQPRFGGTYSLSPDTVLRFSAGKYAEATSSAYTQYNILDQDLPGFLGPTFYKYGFTGTSHPVGPEVSYNYDLSLEHHFANTDVSVKLTPFYRRTNGQLANFFLDQKTAFVSGLNAGSQVAQGVEFELTKGDFSRNGIAGLLSVALTGSYETFTKLSSGGTVLDTINLSIQGYNQYTSFCATNFSDPRCGGLAAAPTTASQCFDGSSAGAPDPTCTSGTPVANPYWNAPAQPLFDPNARYEPYSTLPGGFQSSANGYVTPLTATLLLDYKHDKFAITPALQFFGGTRYGAPLESSGVDPTTCTGTLPSPISSDPRYPYGAPGGQAYDALTCSGTLASIPNPFTHVFDNLGAFKGPNQLLGHLQVSYEVSPRASLVLNVANIINTCFGGDKEPWTALADHRVCSYSLPGYGGLTPSVGNVYNPGAVFQPFVQFPYQQYFGTAPTSYYLSLKVKL